MQISFWGMEHRVPMLPIGVIAIGHVIFNVSVGILSRMNMKAKTGTVAKKVGGLCRQLGYRLI